MEHDRDLIHDLAVAACAIDIHGRVTRYNQAAAALWGRTPAVGTLWSGAVRLLDAFGGVLDHAASPAARTLREGQAPKGLGMLFAERPDGSQTPFLSRPSLLHGADGEIAGVLELMLDPHPPELIDLAAVRLAAIVSSSNDSIIGQSLDGRITSWNDGATQMFGWRPYEMIGEPISRIIPPELLDEEDIALDALKRGERLEPFDTERIARHGGRISISLTVSPIRDAAGQLIGASKIARDITVRKAAGAMQGQLIEELNHRVRNTLATIQAMADQSLRLSPGPEVFARSFADRVRALARVHDLLVDREMAGADLAAIINAEFGAYGLGMRVAMDGPPVVLEARVAVQMALVLHELADNARRYGALSGRAGRVTVSWRILGGPGGLRLVLDWRERGPVLAAAGASPGCGFLLIERSLAVNGGTAVQRSEPEGLAWEIRLPLPRLSVGLPTDDEPLREDQARYAAPGATLHGCRVLVVEDEPMIALQIEAHLVAAGATVVGPVGIIGAAARLIESEPLDAALLDATLAGEPVDALAVALAARGVPFAFASGHGPSALPERFRDRPLLGKPFSEAALLGLIRTLVSSADGAVVVPLRKQD